MDPEDPLPFEVGGGAVGGSRARKRRRSSILKTSNARQVLQVNTDSMKPYLIIFSILRILIQM